MRKQIPTPVVAISTPAIAGPKIREALKRLELSAIALGSSERPTIWMVKAWRTGVSRMSTDPLAVASRNTSHTWALWVSASPASAAATHMSAAWVKISARRPFSLSASEPPNRPKSA